MRLLYICNDFGIRPDGTKGASIHLRAITGALCHRGHDVWLVSPHPGPGAGHPVRALVKADGGDYRAVPRRLKRWLAERDCDTACALQLRPLLFNEWALDRARAVAADHAIDAVIERLALCSTLGADLARALDVPLIIEANAVLSQEARAFRSVHDDGLVSAIERKTLQAADAVTAVSEPLARQLSGLGVADHRITVVPNGVDVDMFTRVTDDEVASARDALGLWGRQVVGFAGSVKPWHGVDDLIAAFARIAPRVPDASLLVVGDGPMLETLRIQARELELADRVVFTGAVPHSRMAVLVNLMDVAVAPFRPLSSFYFSPIKLFEYMAGGALVVASDLGQIAEVIEHGRSGLLYRAGDVDRLAETLARGLGGLDERWSMIDTARRAVRDRYTWRRAAMATEKVVADAVDARRAATKTAIRSLAGELVP